MSWKLCVIVICVLIHTNNADLQQNVTLPKDAKSDVVTKTSVISTSTTTSTELTTTIAPPATTTLSPFERCEQKSNTSCQECIKDPACFWCEKNDECHFWVDRHGWPSMQGCEMSEIRYGNCWLNMEAVLIGCSIAAFLLFVIIVTLCCCCCQCCYCAKERARKNEERQRLLMNEEHRTYGDQYQRV